VGVRGADHNRSGAYEVDFSDRVDRKHATIDAVQYAIETEDKAALMDSLVVCKFLRGVFEDFYGEAADMLRLVTGWEATADELRETARRIVHTKRQFNLLAGWTPEEDTLPDRFLESALDGDPEAALSREQLGTLILPPQFQKANVTPARSAAEIEQIFQDARKRLNEGLMIKDAESFYLPGTRGMFWFKLKRELATLDVVVIAAELGHGKRNNVLSDYTFAVRDETTGELLPIGKAYSGLTDVEIAELTEHFKQNTIADHGRYRRVNPNVVLEVAFNSIQPSTRHASGLALRFPRIKAIRRDKNVDSIDTLQYARELAMQSTNSPNSFGKSA